MRHPGVVIGNNLHKEKHTSELATNFNNQLQLLSKIVETEPQSIYKAFVSGLKNKVTYFICTIPDTGELILLLENTISQKFVSVIASGDICSANERGLNIPSKFPDNHQTANKFNL